jgi:hypothetical protein
MNGYERFHPKTLREMALTKVIEHIRADDNNTRGISIGPVRLVGDG